MHINHLDHVNLRTAQMNEMADWYTSVLGIARAKRPNFPDVGEWLASNETVMVHLVAIDEPNMVGSEASLKLEHFAFKASGSPDDFETKLKRLEERYTRVDVDHIQMTVFNVWDPDGNHIHVDFPFSE